AGRCSRWHHRSSEHSTSSVGVVRLAQVRSPGLDRDATSTAERAAQPSSGTTRSPPGSTTDALDGPWCSKMTHKVVLITGGNSGLGKATATELARLGYTVVITARNAER